MAFSKPCKCLERQFNKLSENIFLPNSDCVKSYDQTTTVFCRLLLKLEN